ncbi:hypothetical protein OROMI_022074 [Orobanche minor]
MFSVRGLTRISRSVYSRGRWVYSSLGSINNNSVLEHSTHFPSTIRSSQE